MTDPTTTNHTTPSPLGRRIRALREAAGWTRSELARRAGNCDTSTIWRIESGAVADLTTRTALALARALGCSIADLVQGDPAPGAEALPYGR